jgi:hypothetical protein
VPNFTVPLYSDSRADEHVPDEGVGDRFHIALGPLPENQFAPQHTKPLEVLLGSGEPFPNQPLLLPVP